ncbi:protein translocase subunit SecD [Kocuria sp.]|jgi:preprotein translocase subunit SecD|uniref:protein translocase subunit SecD n=1 Tax=Kocuria sp. TaxID=1871328 RepID=UPI002811FD89|nr:protein translocase subunit SecD [Kocuria sp.]HST73323.1 protein translocase subunit SecD [Kocuria rosea]
MALTTRNTSGGAGPDAPDGSRRAGARAGSSAPAGPGVRAALSGARRSLLGLLVLLALLAGLLAWGAGTDRTGWGPKLALDLEGGTQMILSPSLRGDDEGREITPEQLSQAVEIIRQRVDGSGVSEAEISTQSGDNIVVSMPGVPSAETRELIQSSAEMNFRPVLTTAAAGAVPEDQRTPKDELPEPTGEPADSSDPNWITPELYRQFEATDCTATVPPEEREAQPADEPVVACEPDTGTKYLLGPVEIQGTGIQDASYGTAQNSTGVSLNQFAVNLQFGPEATDRFRALSERLYGIGQTTPGDPRSQFAILLDGQVVSAPSMNAVISDGKAEITGSFTEEQAKFLSEQLKYGALPVSFGIQSEQQISATLGADQLRMGIVAGLIGLALVCVYSLFQYRLLGLVTISSLVVAGVLTWLAIALLGWSANYRLSLAGVAGLIVAIGQTADSFIVYFERIRDEIRGGRSIPAAVDHGWRRARQTVLASKAVNLLAAVVLYFVAVGNVRGFAFTLGLTALADLLVVFLFTHPVMVLLARTRYFGGGGKHSGLNPEALDAVPLYRGAGRLRQPGEHDGLTIAERRRLAARAAAPEEPAGDAPAGAPAGASASSAPARTSEENA